MKPYSLGKHISTIYRYQSMLINHLFDDLNIGSGQYLFLITINNLEGINQKNLSEQLVIDRANTTRAVKKLEDLGLVESVPDKKDKRNRKLYLTPKGKQLMPIIRNRLQTVSSALTRDMNEEEKNLAETILVRLSTNIQEVINDLKEDHHVE